MFSAHCTRPLCVSRLPSRDARLSQHRLVPSPLKRSSGGSTISFALPELSKAAEAAVDVAATGAAAYDALSSSVDNHGVTEFLHTLYRTLQGPVSHHLDHGSWHADALRIPQEFGENFQGHAGVHDAASLCTDYAAGAVTAAPDAVAFCSVAEAVYGNAPTTLLSLGNWASQKLETAQSLDPSTVSSLQSSLSQLMTAAIEAINYQAATEADKWTRALVLGLQQTVLSLRSPDSGISLQQITAAQQAMSGQLEGGTAGLNTLLGMVFGVIALVVACIPPNDWKPPAAPLKDQIPLRYDPDSLADYYSRRPVSVMQRTVTVVTNITGFVLVLVSDAKLGKWQTNMPLRSVQARELAQRLGAAYIKIAQAASTRVDMMPQAWLEEFAKLQDAVPPFCTVEARAVLEDGLGCPVDQVFDWLSEEPLASASLGQVYKGKLRDNYGGGEVAVKVQRPGVLEQVSLDVFLMRRAALIFSKFPGMNNQWAAMMDDWAYRFFQEMDYQLEAYNTLTFKRQMASLQGIRVANVYPDLTTRKVLVMEWVDGEKLSESRSEDVRALCSTLLNCYLIQLLETGLLHADPHPGNLMRTADGKIVILDFGLMTEVTEEQRITLVEYIAHLTMEDWSAIANDLVALGFLPDGIPPNSEHLLIPILKKVMSTLLKGGGIRGGFNVGAMTGELHGVSKDYQLVVPPYFALILRAFAVIEGIALNADPGYAIVVECLPYLSRRLLTDNNPRMRAALRKLLYGDGERLDIVRLQKLINSFASFSTSAAPRPTATSSPSSSNSNASFEERIKGRALNSPLRSLLLDDGPVMNDATKEALRVVFSKNGNYAQELIVDELVVAVDAMSREALGEALKLVLSSATTVAALRSVEVLKPLRAMIMPLPLPMEVLTTLQPAVALTSEDRQALDTLRGLLDLVQPSLARLPDVAASGGRAIRVAGELWPMMPELIPGVQNTMEMFFKQLVRRIALRMLDDLETGSARASTQQYSSSSSSSSLLSSSQPLTASTLPPSTVDPLADRPGIWG